VRRAAARTFRFEEERKMVYDPQVGNGKQRTYFIEPDTIVIEFEGVVLPEEGAEICRRHEAWAPGRPRVFIMVDAAKLERIDPDVRRMANESMQRMPMRGLTVHSAPLKARMIIKLLFTAFRLFSKQADLAPLSYFNTREESLAWIASRRATLEAEAKAAGAATASA